jgi:hypothetical protein
MHTAALFYSLEKFFKHPANNGHDADSEAMLLYCGMLLWVVDDLFAELN